MTLTISLGFLKLLGLFLGGAVAGAIALYVFLMWLMYTSWGR